MIWAFENGHRLNLGHIIIHHLIYARTKNQIPLPCGAKIYKHFGDDLSKEHNLMLTPRNTLNASRLEGIKFIKEAPKPFSKKKKQINEKNYSAKKHEDQMKLLIDFET